MESPKMTIFMKTDCGLQSVFRTVCNVLPEVDEMTCFYLVRHAATDALGYSFSGRLPGIGLNSEGQRQARALAERFSRVPVRTILSSPSDRARETAGMIAAAAGLPVQASCHFDEIEVGEWTGLSFEALNQRKEFRLFNSVRSLSRPPAGELMLEVQSRSIAELLRISQQCGDCGVVIVTHSDIIKAVMAYFLGMPLDLAQRLVVDPASVSIVEIGRDHVRVVKINS